MRRAPDRREQIVGLFVVTGAAIVFGPVLWFLGRWQEAIARDPRSGRWLAEQLSAHPYLAVELLLLGVTLWGWLVILILVSVAKRLAARLVGRERSGQRSTRGLCPAIRTTGARLRCMWTAS